MDNENKKEVIGSRKITFNKSSLLSDDINTTQSLPDLAIKKENKKEVIEEKKVEEKANVPEVKEELFKNVSDVKPELFTERILEESKKDRTFSDVIDGLFNNVYFNNVMLILSKIYIIFYMLIMGGNIVLALLNKNDYLSSIDMYMFIIYIAMYIGIFILGLLSLYKVKNVYLTVLVIILINIMV